MENNINPQHIHLTVVFTGKKGSSAQLETLIKEAVIASRKEEACLQYDLHRDTADQDIFILHETWADQPGLDLHNTMPYLKSFITEAADLLEVPLKIYRTDFIL